MDVHVEKTALVRGLMLAKSVAESRSMMPILSHVLVRAEDDKLVLGSTDLIVSLVAEVEAEVKSKGTVTVEARTLSDIVKGLPGDRVSLRTGANHHLTVAAGKAHFTLHGRSPKDFPKLPAAEADATFKTTDAKIVTELLARTCYAVADDPARPHLSSLCLQASDGIARAVATDGHRLAKAEAPWTAPPIDPAILIPRKGLAEIRRVLNGDAETCDLAVHDHHLFVRAAGATLAVRLTDAAFPPWEQIVPKENGKTLTIRREALLDAVRRVSLVATNGTRAVKFSSRRNGVFVESENPELGDGTETLDAKYEGDPCQIAFNPRYLIEPLEAVETAEVRLAFSGETSPALLHAVGRDDFVYVVMPMRV